MLIIKRKEAVLTGATKYFTGKPCSRGHISERFVSSFGCVECGKIRAGRPEVAAKRNEWFAKNKEAKREYDIVYRAKNPRDRSTEKQYTATKAKRKAAKINRTPSWLSPDDLWLIKEAYELAALRTKTLGFQWHVDHIVPLQGKNVSGLHVPWNLQVIPASVNMSKHNKWEG